MTRSYHNIRIAYGWYETFVEKTRSHEKKYREKNGCYSFPKRDLYPQGKVVIHICPFRAGKCMDSFCEDYAIKKDTPKPGTERKSMNTRNRKQIVDDAMNIYEEY